MLTLPIKDKWFAMIKSREKKEEYRARTKYYDSRFLRFIGKKIFVAFRNGYRMDSPTVICEVIPQIKTGKTEWGAEPGELYYALAILSVKEV